MMFTPTMKPWRSSVGCSPRVRSDWGEAAPAAESAQAKLERVPPVSLKSRLRALSETVTPTCVPRPRRRTTRRWSRSAPLLASTGGRLRYRTPHHNGHGAGFRESKRDVDPAVSHGGPAGYMVGWCHLRRDLRSFRFDRIQHAELLRGPGAHFEAPQSFDAAYLAHGVATLPRAIGVVVPLKTDLKTAREELFEAIGVFQPDPAGEGALLHSQADDLDWYAYDNWPGCRVRSRCANRQRRDALRAPGGA